MKLVLVHLLFLCRALAVRGQRFLLPEGELVRVLGVPPWRLVLLLHGEEFLDLLVVEVFAEGSLAVSNLNF